ncbi:MAG: iron donor protein CyaY [Deltaproteobacteria bacterium]|nr:iron donor protein CyaY [Deltaproteobacteria bacterium]
MMDDRAYNELVESLFGRITTALDRLDPDDVEVDKGGGYLTLIFRDKTRCVISTQRPVREIWMAHDATAWHFSAPGADGRWVTHKTHEELIDTLTRLVSGRVGHPVQI